MTSEGGQPPEDEQQREKDGKSNTSDRPLRTRPDDTIAPTAATSACSQGGHVCVGNSLATGTGMAKATRT